MRDAAMKKLMLLLVLTMAPGLGGESPAVLSQAAAGGAPTERLVARPVYENGTKRQVNTLADKNHSNEKTLLRAGPADEVEVKRLKLVFLLMMSLGQYRSPVH
jgi:hypothetical protein